MRCWYHTFMFASLYVWDKLQEQAQHFRCNMEKTCKLQWASYSWLVMFYCTCSRLSCKRQFEEPIFLNFWTSGGFEHFQTVVERFLKPFNPFLNVKCYIIIEAKVYSQQGHSQLSFFSSYTLFYGSKAISCFLALQSWGCPELNLSLLIFLAVIVF